MHDNTAKDKYDDAEEETLMIMMILLVCLLQCSVSKVPLLLQQSGKEMVMMIVG